MEALPGPPGEALRKAPAVGEVVVPVVPVDACKLVVNAAESTVAGWVWAGRLATLSDTVVVPVAITVTFLVPAICPWTMGESPGPLPWEPTGNLPRRSGRPKVLTPSPPYVLPSKLQRSPVPCQRSFSLGVPGPAERHSLHFFCRAATAMGAQQGLEAPQSMLSYMYLFGIDVSISSFVLLENIFYLRFVAYISIAIERF